MIPETITVAGAETADDIDDVRALFVEYEEWLGVDLCFQGFAEELRSLPGRYTPPRGQLLLAREDAKAVGTVGMWPLGRDVCELKRLYVRPPWRGRGLGRRLAEAVIAEAASAGYARMRLDSLDRLAEALALYGSMGFVEIPAYHDDPLEGMVYMQFDLTSLGTAAGAATGRNGRID